VTTVDHTAPQVDGAPLPAATDPRRTSQWWRREDRPAWALPAHAGVTTLVAVLYTWGLSSSVGMGNGFYAASTAPYKTRMVVYRPINPKRFDGTAVVEWLNVSGGVDAAAAWLTDHVQMIRSGMVYVGVSAQAAGIVGSSGSLGASAGQAGGIKGSDPARYGSLNHPGDSYSYSIFEQAGAAIRRDASTVLGGLAPKRILALGESQSAFRLVTYIDALQPQ
jgi:hypothetical protein